MSFADIIIDNIRIDPEYNRRKSYSVLDTLTALKAKGLTPGQAIDEVEHKLYNCIPSSVAMTLPFDLKQAWLSKEIKRRK